jgi:hypothetical protein
MMQHMNFFLDFFYTNSHKAYKTRTRLTKLAQGLQNSHKAYKTRTRLTKLAQGLQNSHKAYKKSCKAQKQASETS